MAAGWLYRGSSVKTAGWFASPPSRARVGWGDSSAPYVVRRADGNGVEGALVEALTAVSGRLGIELVWIEAQEGVDRSLSGRRVDIWPMAAITAERKRSFHASEAWIQTFFCLLMRADGAGAEPQTSPSRIAHRAAAGTRGVVREHLHGSRSVEYATREGVIAAVCSGSVDAGLVETRVIQAALLDRPKACEGIKLATRVLDKASLPLAVVSTLESAHVAELAGAGLMDLARSGDLVRIFSRWNLATSLETNAIFEVTAAQDRSRRAWFLAAVLSCAIALLGWMNLRVRRARQLADRASAAKSEFLANMSHEIRTPLNGVVGLAHLLVSGAPRLDPEERRMVTDISECAEALLAVVNDILDFSKIEAGKLTLESAVIGLPGCVKSAAVPALLAENSKGIALALDIAPGVPDFVTGDSTRLRQVLANLLSDAVKFTADGSVLIRVKPAGAGRVCFIVEDSGIGIDAATLARLFRPFTQADTSTSRRYGGTGLGLTISKRLVELMGGAIAVDSTPGTGSRFSFTRPLPEAAPPPSAGENSSSEPANGQLRILVAEDSAVNQRVILALLSRMGHSVTLAPNGKEAVAAVHSGSSTFDLILMDCQMPEMDGYEATRQIRCFENRLQLPPVPIVALTAHAMSIDRDRCLAAGMDDYLSKPVDRDKLRAAVARYPVRTKPPLPSTPPHPGPR